MIIGYIKYCQHCQQESYIKAGIDLCPKCGKGFNEFIPNKAPAGWVKKENYEMSRNEVDKMLKDGTLTEKDLKW